LVAGFNSSVMRSSSVSTASGGSVAERQYCTEVDFEYLSACRPAERAVNATGEASLL
jgi:hypothetical protein